MAPQGLSVWARAQRTPAAGRGRPRSRAGSTSAIRASPSRSPRKLVLGSMIPESERSWAALMRQEARGRMAHLLPAGTILCLPTTPFPAPLRGQTLSALDPLRDRITCLCAQGGLAGHPQVSLPGATVDGLPVGLSIIGPRGSDASLVAVAQALGGGRQRREGSDAEPPGSRRGGTRPVRALRAGADRQERRRARRHLLEQPAHHPLRHARARLRLRRDPRPPRGAPARARASRNGASGWKS